MRSPARERRSSPAGSPRWRSSSWPSTTNPASTPSMPTADPAAEIFRSSWRLERVRLVVFAVILGAMCAATVAGFRDAYPTTAARMRFAAAFKDNLALRLFYGIPHDLVSVAGYAEFRLGGMLAVVIVG